MNHCPRQRVRRQARQGLNGQLPLLLGLLPNIRRVGRILHQAGGFHGRIFSGVQAPGNRQLAVNGGLLFFERGQLGLGLVMGQQGPRGDQLQPVDLLGELLVGFRKAGN